MSKGSRVREVLEKLKDDCLFRQTEFYKDTNICQDVCRDAHGYVDQALSDLAEIVRGEKTRSVLIGWNVCCDHIAKLFTDKENPNEA